MKSKKSIELVAYDDKIVVSKLLQLAFYDYSEYNGKDLNIHGDYQYKYLDNYWTEAGRFPYIFKVDGKIAGFCLLREQVMFQGVAHHNLAEFLILRKYRRQGIGKYFAFKILEKHPGKWMIDQEEANLPAQLFWNKIISEFTNGQFRASQKGDENHPYLFFRN